MARFSLNRQWTFILALGLCLACCSVSLRSVPVAHADVIKDGVDIGDWNGGGEGDPDVPDGPGKGRPSGMTAQGSTHVEVRAAGDSRASVSAGLWRLRVVLESLRSAFFRF
jgi:hypothetical protein